MTVFITFFKIFPNFDLEYGLNLSEIENKLKKLIRFSEPDNKKKTLFIWPEGVFSGYSYKEISEMLSISIDTSKWHVKDARKRLKSIVGNSSICAGFLIIIFLNL